MDSFPQIRTLTIGAVNGIVAGRHGVFLVNRYDYYVGQALIKYGEYGEIEWRNLAQLVRPGNTVVEVGANIGSHTVSLAKTVGPTGRVIAVEPQRIIHQYLCANIALNGLGNVETYLAGCGAKPGEFMVPPLDYFASTFQNFGGIALSPEGAGERVTILRLDDIMKERPVQLLKIDVEGMEAEVLRGATGLIANSRPFLYLENDRMDKSDALISLLWSLDYRIFWDLPKLYNPDNYFNEADDIYKNMVSANMLCIPRESSLSVQNFAEITSLGLHPLLTAAAGHRGLPVTPPVTSPPRDAPVIVTTLNAETAEKQARSALASGAFEAAEALVRPFLASGSGPLPLWRILATALRQLGRIQETLTIQQMLVDTLPGDLPLRFDLSETLLLLGEFERGWREYRYRYSLPHTTILDRKVQKPGWEGGPIPGKTLLIHDEQGYGDSLQFMRMVPWAKQRSGARVVLEINHDTASFARRMKGIDHLALRGELPPPFDVHCQMMSLPAAMGLKLADLPGTMPYLSADPARLTRWRKRLAKLPRLLVALVWAGRPTHFNDANRSTGLATLAPLGMDGVTFLSIQKGPKAAEAAEPPAGMHLVDLGDEIKDFDDTAAILSLADLLISVDSSPVHLAGALGRPAWVMLPLVPDWRWLLEREDTPWYPSLRLFRQSVRGDWTSVVMRMVKELTALRDRAGQAR